MDAFSFALSIGTFNIQLKKSIVLTTIIGLFHFFMPMLGFFLGKAFKVLLHIKFNYLTGVIFLFIALEMIKEFKKEEENIDLSIIGILVLALSVSIDSFAVGFTLKENIYTTCLLFASFSAGFTYIGLQIGKSINKYVGPFSKIIGITIMSFLAVYSFVKY